MSKKKEEEELSDNGGGIEKRESFNNFVFMHQDDE